MFNKNNLYIRAGHASHVAYYFSDASPQSFFALFSRVIDVSRHASSCFKYAIKNWTRHKFSAVSLHPSSWRSSSISLHLPTQPAVNPGGQPHPSPPGVSWLKHSVPMFRDWVIVFQCFLTESSVFQYFTTEIVLQMFRDWSIVFKTFRYWRIVFQCFVTEA